MHDAGLKFSALDHRNFIFGERAAVARAHLHVLHRVYDIWPINDLAKNHMLAIQILQTCFRCNEELDMIQKEANENRERK